MKNIVFSIAAILLAAVSTSAQTAAPTSPLRTNPNADYIRNERVHLEKETELKILEKLEESRLREEQARMQRIEATNFSVVGQPAQQQQPQQVVPVQTQTSTF